MTKQEFDALEKMANEWDAAAQLVPPDTYSEADLKLMDCAEELRDFLSSAQVENEQEPVAWMVEDAERPFKKRVFHDEGEVNAFKGCLNYRITPLYAIPPSQVEVETVPIEYRRLYDVCENLRHWHCWGKDNEGMVVSAEAVRAIWTAHEAIKLPPEPPAPNKIQRYAIYPHEKDTMWLHSDGPWVLFSDHEAEVALLKQDVSMCETLAMLVKSEHDIEIQKYRDAVRELLEEVRLGGEQANNDLCDKIEKDLNL